MSIDDRVKGLSNAVEPGGESVGRIEHRVLSRRRFLAGVGLGAVAGAGGTALFVRSDVKPRSRTVATEGVALPVTTRYALPAVGSSANGLVVATEFTLSEGSGELFVNLNGVEVRHDLQLALREAMQTATRLTGASFSNVATHVSFETPTESRTTLRGKSWEAGLTVALVGALEGREPPGRTLVTGVVGRDGGLLPVGGIEAKARAARATGAETLLVPSGLAVPVPEIHVRDVGSISEAVAVVFDGSSSGRPGNDESRRRRNLGSDTD